MDLVPSEEVLFLARGGETVPRPEKVAKAVRFASGCPGAGAVITDYRGPDVGEITEPASSCEAGGV